MKGPARRLALLAEGCFTPLDAKTAVGMLRYRPQQVAVVVDSKSAGRRPKAVRERVDAHRRRAGVVGLV